MIVNIKTTYEDRFVYKGDINIEHKEHWISVFKDGRKVLTLLDSRVLHIEYIYCDEK